jgi:hypothetical protein
MLATIVNPPDASRDCRPRSVITLRLLRPIGERMLPLLPGHSVGSSLNSITRLLLLKPFECNSDSIARRPRSRARHGN